MSITNKAYPQIDIDRFNNFTDSIKTIAILPFKLNFAVINSETDTTDAMKKGAALKTAVYLQNKLYEWFESRQKRSNISFQDVHHTDSLLLKTKLPLADILKLNECALCKYLGVNSIVYCELMYSNPNSDLGQEVRKKLTTFCGDIIFDDLFATRKNYEKINYGISIFYTSGEMIYKNTYKNTQGEAPYIDTLLQKFIRKLCNKLPFIKY